jgi:hypothetical protein
VLLPVKHVVIVDDDFRRDFEAACLAQDKVSPDFPVRTGLALANQQVNLLLVGHL